MSTPLLFPPGDNAPLRQPDHFAEVVETSTTEFLAQCLEPEDLRFPTMPPFGSWVWARDAETGYAVYAVVYQVSSSPVDAVHRTRALGLSLEELRQQQPQIFTLLKTEFRASILGYREGDAGAFRQYLPPRPPQIHQSVHRCTSETVLTFTESLEFLRTVLQLTQAPTDALVGTLLREGYRLRQGDREWLVQAGRHVSLLLRDDYDRLRAILAQCHLGD